MKISARNKLKGTVVDVVKGATTSHVRIDIGTAVPFSLLRALIFTAGTPSLLGYVSRRTVVVKPISRRAAGAAEVPAWPASRWTSFGMLDGLAA